MLRDALLQTSMILDNAWFVPHLNRVVIRWLLSVYEKVVCMIMLGYTHL
jgi:hypothetical protein